MNIKIILSMIYAALLCWIYNIEIVTQWAYMRFDDHQSISSAVAATLSSSLLGSILPNDRSARSYLISWLHYLFFVPSIVYASFNDVQFEYVISIIIAIVFIYYISRINLKPETSLQISRNYAIGLSLISIVLALALQAMFGGLRRFNLNPELVYEYRTEVMDELPLLFHYIFSNIANVIIPMSIVLALRINSRILLAMSFLSGLILFGMTQHKSVFFTTLMVSGFYYFLIKLKNIQYFGLLPIFIVLICVLEILYQINLAPVRDSGTITSYFVRRALLVPPMLDSAYVDFFSHNDLYHWSTSKFSLGLTKSPYHVVAPFLIGAEYFNDPGLSANTGIIGSGYANFGLFGVVLYSGFSAIIIAYINSHGKRIGAEFAAAISLSTLLLIVNSSDITTAFLSHGLLLLMIVLAILPDGIGRVST